MSSAGATIFVVDDDPSILRALTRFLKTEGYTVETFASPREFLDRPPHDCPGCLILDLRMPGVGGLEVQEALAGAGHLLPIVFMSGRGDVPTTVRAMKAGAVDFLTKPLDDSKLLAVIASAVARSRVMRSDRDERRALEARIASLTPREREVFPLVARGLPNKKIAGLLGTAEKTVKVHRARVMEKLGAESLADLVRMAERVEEMKTA
jgi:FixJ family two-component response regulator